MCRYTKLLWVGLLLPMLLGCSALGTIVVYFDVEGEIKVARESGPITTSKVVPMRRVPDTRRIFPYPDLYYDHETFSMKLVVSSSAIWSTLTSKVPYPVMIRYDQATLRSNFHQAEMPLKTYDMFSGMIGKDGKMRPPRPEGVWVTPKANQLGIGKQGGFTLHLPYQELFPSGELFNVEIRGKETDLVADGKGNTLWIKIPIEYEGKREVLEFQLTAKEAKAKLIYR